MHLHVNMQCTGFFISRNSSHSLIPTLLCKIVMMCFGLILRRKIGVFYTGCISLMEFWGIVLSFYCHDTIHSRNPTLQNYNSLLYTNLYFPLPYPFTGTTTCIFLNLLIISPAVDCEHPRILTISFAENT